MPEAALENGHGDGNSAAPAASGGGGNSAVMMKFRNYIPKTADLKDYVLDKPTTVALEAELEDRCKEAVDAAQEEDAVMAIAPKKPNWDLKRDVQKKMQVLGVKTDKAIMELIRRKIKQESGEAPPASKEKADPEDMKASRNEASIALAREVGKRNVEDIDDTYD